MNWYVVILMNILENYKSLVFIDSNVILEARVLEELPWSEIDAIGPILIMLVPTLLREVDSKKRDGRLSVRAREFNRRVAPIANDGLPVRLDVESPRVDLTLAVCNKIDWDSYDDLDPGEGDARLVAEVLNVRGVPFSQRIVVSQDINPLFMAKRHGLKTFHIPETWLAKAEQGPLEKELAKFKLQVADYAKREPVFEASLDTLAQPVLIYKVNKLSCEDANVLASEIILKNPQVEQSRETYGISSLAGFDCEYDEKYEYYVNKIVPRFVEDLHSKLEVRFGQIPFKLTLANVGKVCAEKLCANIKIVGGWFNAKPIFSGTYPSAPKPKDKFALPGYMFRHPKPSVVVGRHEIEVDEIKRSGQFFVQCENFRQGQNWELSGVIWLDPYLEKDVTVIIKVTASNYHGEFEQIVKISKVVQVSEVFDLIERKTSRGKVDHPTYQMMMNAMEREEYGAIDWDLDGCE